MPQGLIGEGLRALLIPRFEVRFLTTHLQDAISRGESVDATIVHLDLLGSDLSSWDLLRSPTRTVVVVPREDDPRISRLRARGARFLVNGQASGCEDLVDSIFAALPTSLPHDRDSLKRLSRRELEVLRLLAQGQSDAEIARAIFISVNGVKKHVKAILLKMGAQNRTQAAVRAVISGAVTPEAA
jgi:DNA-binding NarL/FixJ family response regulator